MKRKLVVFYLLVLTLSMIAVTALAWVCPSCSQENSGNFCSNCGKAKPQTLSAGGSGNTISNVRFSVLDNGDVQLKWDDSVSGAPYNIQYTTDEWQIYWFEDASYNSTQATLFFLVPGVTYDITITNAKGNEKTVEYQVPRPIYTEFKTGGKYMKLTETRFSISDLEAHPLSTFDIQISWPKLKYDREYTGKLVLKTPFGYTGSVRYYTTYTLENKYSYNYNTYSLLNDWLAAVEQDFGEIPQGEYTFEMYLDGQLYDYASFRLSK